jgi:hypothetical protein
MNILQRDDDALVGRDIDAGYTSHFILHLRAWRPVMPASGGDRPMQALNLGKDKTALQLLQAGTPFGRNPFTERIARRQPPGAFLKSVGQPG